MKLSSDKLIERDAKIFELIAEGHTAKEIAEILSMSNRSVEGRIERLKDMWNAKNLPNLIAILFREKLLK